MSKVDLLKKQMRASAASSRVNKPSASPYVNEIEEMIQEMTKEPIEEPVKGPIEEFVKEPAEESVKESIQEPLLVQDPVAEPTEAQEVPVNSAPKQEVQEAAEVLETVEVLEAIESQKTESDIEKTPETVEVLETVEALETSEPEKTESKNETVEILEDEKAQPVEQKDDVQSNQTDTPSPVNQEVQHTKLDRVLTVKQFKSTELISWGALLSEEANDTLSYYAAVHSMNAYNVVNSIIASEIEWENAHPEFPSKEFVMSNIRAKRNKEIVKVSRSLTITEEHRSFVKAASIRCGMKMQEFMEYLIMEYLSEGE